MIQLIEDTVKKVLAKTLLSILAFRLGVIPADYVGGRPTVHFDGEEASSSRAYPYLATYAPAAGDRVLVAVVGNGGVVLGKII